MSVVQNSWRGTAQKRRVSSRKMKLVPELGDGSDMDDKSNPLFGEVLEPEAPAPEAPKTEQVTYTPGPDDPTSVKWHGYTFHANVPKAVANADLVERARGNKFFKVGEFTESDVVTTREEPPAPKTAEGSLEMTGRYQWVKDFLPMMSRERCRTVIIASDGDDNGDTEGVTPVGRLKLDSRLKTSCRAKLLSVPSR